MESQNEYIVIRFVYNDMPTTVRVEDPVKRELDRLQGELLSGRGERLSHSELLARLLRFVRANEDSFLAAGDEPHRPSHAEIDRLLASLPDVRTRTDARRYKATLYGERP